MERSAGLEVGLSTGHNEMGHLRECQASPGGALGGRGKVQPHSPHHRAPTLSMLTYYFSSLCFPFHFCLASWISC